uniref:SFRICE_019509 n=1 Tax=Spodoptera frugiperda TaxID=7108 RepID=A0A2H1V6Q4_SPOFR
MLVTKHTQDLLLNLGPLVTAIYALLVRYAINNLKPSVTLPSPDDCFHAFSHGRINKYQNSQAECGDYEKPFYVDEAKSPAEGCQGPKSKASNKQTTPIHLEEVVPVTPVDRAICTPFIFITDL